MPLAEETSPLTLETPQKIAVSTSRRSTFFLYSIAGSGQNVVLVQAREAFLPDHPSCHSHLLRPDDSVDRKDRSAEDHPGAFSARPGSSFEEKSSSEARNRRE